VKERGYSNITEIGSTLGIGNTLSIYPYHNARNTNNMNLFSLTSINGYQINRHGFIGLGMGTEIGKHYLLVPLFIDGRYYILKKRVTPLLDFGAGYALTWIITPSYKDFTNGFAFAYSLAGVRIYTSKNASWIFSLGYRFQYTTTIWYFYLDNDFQEQSEFVVKHFSHFFTLKTGLTF
jgi:hypothetical protein